MNALPHSSIADETVLTRNRDITLELVHCEGNYELNVNICLSDFYLSSLKIQILKFIQSSFPEITGIKIGFNKHCLNRYNVTDD